MLVQELVQTLVLVSVRKQELRELVLARKQAQVQELVQEQALGPVQVRN